MASIALTVANHVMRGIGAALLGYEMHDMTHEDKVIVPYQNTPVQTIPIEKDYTESIIIISGLLIVFVIFINI